MNTMISEPFANVLKIICCTLQESEVIWAVTGSLGFVLQGMKLPVHDIDLQTDKAGAYQIEHCFADKIIRPVAFSSSNQLQSHFGELRINGIKVEIMGDLQKKLPNGEWEVPVDIRPIRQEVLFQALCVPVLSLAYEYEAYLKLGRMDKAERIRQYLNKHERIIK